MHKEKYKTMNLQLGAGDVILNGFENTDIQHAGGIDRIVDVREALPYPDESVNILVANHLLELLNLRELSFLMKEIYRVLKPGGYVRFHFGSEKIHLEPGYLAALLANLTPGSLVPVILDKESTRTGNEEVLKSKGQHGPSIVIEMQK